jgi:hypothetical protein
MTLPRSQPAATVLLGMLFAAANGVCHADGPSKWVQSDPSGKLVYRTLPSGDRIVDFSYAGYAGGGVAIPEVAVKITVQPSGDDSANIQRALDDLSQMPLVEGHRGAVSLAPGTYRCDTPLNISSAGVVLRGSTGTLLQLTGAPHVAILVTGRGEIVQASEPTPILDAYIPSGADSFRVASTARLRVGDTIQITRPVTHAWVAFMGMSTLVRDGRPQRWLSGALRAERAIRAISGNRVTVTPPLCDSYDSRYLNPPGSTVAKVRVSGAISQVGIERLRIVSPPQPIEITQPHYSAVKLDGVVDSWVRDLEIHDTVNSVGVDDKSSRITIQNVRIAHSVATLGAAKPEDFADSGTQVLFDRCSGEGHGLFFFATMGRTQGPNVLLHCSFQGKGSIQPHMRWSTGLLVDNCQVPSGSIDLMNRGIMGSGHGWTIGWSVVWNCRADSFLIQQPPGSVNWGIGCIGAEQRKPMPGLKRPNLPSGIFDSHNRPVLPSSLYLAQLRERLGDQAVRNIGY